MLLRKSHDQANGIAFVTDATKTSYFRGRKLRGRSIKIAEGYEGIFAPGVHSIKRGKAPDDEQ